jgi:hypothetical protein
MRRGAARYRSTADYRTTRWTIREREILIKFKKEQPDASWVTLYHSLQLDRAYDSIVDQWKKLCQQGKIGRNSNTGSFHFWSPTHPSQEKLCAEDEIEFVLDSGSREVGGPSSTQRIISPVIRNSKSTLPRYPKFEVDPPPLSEIRSPSPVIRNSKSTLPRYPKFEFDPSSIAVGDWADHEAIGVTREVKPIISPDTRNILLCGGRAFLYQSRVPAEGCGSNWSFW